MLSSSQIARIAASECENVSLIDVALKKFCLSFASTSDYNVLFNEPSEDIFFRSPSRIFGTPEVASCLDGVATPIKIPLKCSKIIEIDNAAVIGTDVLVNSDFKLFDASAPNSESELNIYMARIYTGFSGHKGIVARRTDSSVQLIAKQFGKEEKFMKSAIFVSFIEPNNYGAFLFRFLPQMVYINSLNIKTDYIIVGARTPWIMECLSILKINTPVVTVAEVYGIRFQKIYMCIGYDNEGLIRPSVLDGIQKIFYSNARLDCDTNIFKIYVTRSFQGRARPLYRRLINENGVERIVSAHGYNIIAPEQHSLCEQVRIFSRATHVLGPSGSGMLNAIFSTRICRLVDFESYHVTIRQHAKIYSSVGSNYAFLFGTFDKSDDRPNVSRSWEIDLNYVLEAMEYCEKSGSM